MITVVMHHPGDPPQPMFLMFGEEFVTHVRRGKPGEIRITTSDGKQEVFEIQEIRCDSCGEVVGMHDPLALLGVPSRVYCWPCHTNLNSPYITKKGS